MKTLQRGVLIAVEGIDGSGKSTLAKQLAQVLPPHGIGTLLTKEPGGTPLGQRIRTILQEKPFALCAKAEYLLFAADRAQHMDELIKPHLDKKMLVISDRMGDSSLVYQGYGRGLDRTMISSINRWAMNDIQPQLTLYIRVDVETALTRIQKRNAALTSFEQEHRDFFQRVIDGFEQLYINRSDVCILDGSLSPDQLVTIATTQVITWLTQQHLLQ